MSTKPKYGPFGELLGQLRRKAGISQQADLAARLATPTTQQSVSRWEAGLSRPRLKQMAELGAALGLKPEGLEPLIVAAGYELPQQATVSFDRPFPIDSLPPETFERLTHYVLKALYEHDGARVHRVGGPGHDQDGLDVEVTFPDGTRQGFQCKRVQRFGPDMVHAAVSAVKNPAAKNVLLISRIASPQARDALSQHAGWDLWDKEDFSERIRSLPKAEQLRIVRIFFTGQEFSLLGVTEEGRWQTADEFFAPYMAGRGAFSHDWALVGRSQELADLERRLNDKAIAAVMLTGAGGFGKTRVLKEAIDKYQSAHPSVLIRFLSATQDATPKSLEELGAGEKLLVIDDAHDRSDLLVIFQYIATHADARLVLSFRPYGTDFIKSQAGNFGLVGDHIAHITLAALSLADTKALAVQVLERFGGSTDQAEQIANLTRDCPLATVMGARIIATEPQHFELAKNDDVFRITLLARFQDAIAGELGTKSDSELVKKLLRVLALVQPFHLEDPGIPPLIKTVEGIEEDDVARLMRVLTEGGVLFKRGGQYRLSPDLLGDYIIEQACIGTDGAPTGYAERVLSASGAQQLEHLLLNLGKLDWRLANGDPERSRLLDGVWGMLSGSDELGIAHIRAVTAVAYYQPARALTFAERLIRQGGDLHDLPELVRYAAYNGKYATRACEILWELGKSDARSLDRSPEHAIRILSELCAVSRNKPISYNELIVDFAISLLNRADVWDHRYSPFDILNGILKPDGHTTTSHGLKVSIGRFTVTLPVVAELRLRAIDAIIKTLPHPKVRAGFLAARSLHEALRIPVDLDPKDLPPWADHISGVIEKVGAAVASGQLDPVVVVELAHAVSWHANYGQGKTRKAARAVYAALPNTLEFRAVRALIDGQGYMLERSRDIQKQAATWDATLTETADELLRAYPDGEQLRAVIEVLIGRISEAHDDGRSSPYVLYSRLALRSTDFARATVVDALARPISRTRLYARFALAKMLREGTAEGLHYATAMVESSAHDIQAEAANAFQLLDLKERQLTESELALLRKLLRSDNEWVVRSAVGAVRWIMNNDLPLGVDLLREVNLGISTRVADDVFLNFAFRDDQERFTALSEDDVRLFLDKMLRLTALDGHWLETFLAAVSQRYARDLAKFFMARVDYGADQEDWKYRPTNYGPYGHVKLNFRASPDFHAILKIVSEWMTSRADVYFREYSAHLFETLFQPFDDLLVSALQSWVDVATEADISAIAKILSEAPANFIFEHRPFVLGFLDRARRFGRPMLERALGYLAASAVGGMKTGIPGQPFPQDLEMKARAEEALKSLPPFSPGYELYEDVLRMAEHNIKRSLREGEAYEDE